MNTKDKEDPFDDPFGDPRDDDDMFHGRERMGDRGRPVITDFVRRAIENTVGQVQNTGTAGRDAISYLLQQGDKGKREVVRVVAKEVGDFLRATDVSNEIVKVLTRVKLEVNASVAFKPTDDGRSVRPEFESTNTAVRDPEGRNYLNEDEDPPEVEVGEGEGETNDLRTPKSRDDSA